MTVSGYPHHQALRARLNAALGELEHAIADLGAPGRAAHLADARAHLQSDAFRLMVVGEFKRGKSTLINALLGQDVLPAKLAPCTAVITEVKYGETPLAVLHPTDLDRPPLEVPVDALKQHVTIDAADLDEDEAAEAVSRSPYGRVEVFYPLPLLAHHVEVIDSPGLNEHRTRTRVALDYLASADALVVVLSCQQALSATELSFIDHELAGRNLRHVFFVWNHHDAVAGSPADEADVRRRTEALIRPRVGPDAKVHYLSAKEALAGRKRLDAALVERSGIEGFEAALERFLVEERGRVKLLAPLRLAESAAREAATELLPRREALLRAPLAELQARYEAQKPRIAELRAQRERLLRSVERRRDALVTAAVAGYQEFVVDLERGMRERVETIDVGAWEAITGRRRAQQQMAETLQAWLDERVRAWQAETLDPLFERHQAELVAEVETRSGEFLDALDAIRQALAPDVRIDAHARARDVSAADRLLSAVGGFFLGGPGAAIEGAGFGFTGMSRGLVVHLGLIVAMSAVGLGGLIFPVLVVVGAGRALHQAHQAAGRLREQVVTDMTHQLRGRLPAVTHELGLRVTQAFDGLVGALDAATGLLVTELEREAATILDARARGEAALTDALAELGRQREALAAATRAVETVRFEVEG